MGQNMPFHFQGLGSNPALGAEPTVLKSSLSHGLLFTTGNHWCAEWPLPLTKGCVMFSSTLGLVITGLRLNLTVTSSLMEVSFHHWRHCDVTDQHIILSWGGSEFITQIESFISLAHSPSISGSTLRLPWWVVWLLSSVKAGLAPLGPWFESSPCWSDK